MDNPPLETQREIYKELENEKTLVAGEEVYLISAQWLQRFKRGTESTCGPINNRQFLINDKLSLERKREKIDYEIITKDMWETLHSWYQGGPTIKVQVVNTDTGPKVILSELKLKCYFNSFEPKEITTNEYVKGKDLREQVMKMFAVPFNEETRLWDYYQDEFRNEIKDEKELRKYNLINGQAIYLEKKKTNGKWFSEKEKEKDIFDIICDSRKYSAQKKPHVCLQDIKDTCFLNVLVQCLLYNNPLKVQIHFYKFWNNEINGSELNISDVFNDLVNFVWFGESSHDSLDSFKKVINKHAPQFLIENDVVSYDSFYKDLLSDLHGCFKRKNDRNKSVITDVFYGQFRRELTCPICGSTKTDFIPYSIISPPAKKSLKVIYIPLKYTDDYIKMNIEIPPHSSFAVISKIFSNYLKKDVKVVLGTYRIMDEIEWELHDYDGISQPHICAFEVENFDSYLIPCKISMKEKSTNFQKIIGKPFLLSFDHPDPTEEEISNCAFNHLKCLWDTNDELDPTEYIKNIVENENYYSESVENKFVNEPIVAKISENYLRGKQLHFDSKYPNLEKSIIDINLNPLFMKNDSITKFSYYKLYCHLKPKIEKPISKISLKNCFSNLCRTSNLGYGNEWKCPKCNQDVCAIEKVGLWTVPDSLIIDVGKINSSGKMFVKYDAELDLTDFFVGQNEYQNEAIYKLCSVVECRSPHQYTSHVFVSNQKQVKGKWYFFDNSGICEADEQSAINESACILFYQRIMNYNFY